MQQFSVIALSPAGTLISLVKKYKTRDKNANYSESISQHIQSHSHTGKSSSVSRHVSPSSTVGQPDQWCRPRVKNDRLECVNGQKQEDADDEMHHWLMPDSADCAADSDSVEFCWQSWPMNAQMGIVLFTWTPSTAHIPHCEESSGPTNHMFDDEYDTDYSQCGFGLHPPFIIIEILRSCLIKQ